MSNIHKTRNPLPTRDTVNKFIGEFPDLYYDGAKIICKVCNISCMFRTRHACNNHINSKQHTKNKNCMQPEFMFDLAFMLIACNLPFRLLDQQAFHDFWNKYQPNLVLPSRTMLRRYVPSVREEIENKIKSQLNNKKLWLCVDVITDCRKHSIVNVIVRVLEPLNPTFSLLLASKRLENCTDEEITRVVLNTLDNFQISKTQLLMFVTDGTATMRSVGQSLKEECGRFLHVTCKVQALHLVTETIREYFPEVDALVENTKKVFLKSPERIQEFHKQCPDIPEPPQLDLTIWGTWLKAAFYYLEHFQKIKPVILQFSPDEAEAIKVSQKTFQDFSIKTDLKTIHDNYQGLLDGIEKLQNTALSVEESLQIVHDVNTQLHAISDAKNDCVIQQFESILENDTDFTTLKQICNGTSADPLIKFKDYFNYACITTVDVQRSFSRYKDIFSSKRTSFTETNAETNLMLHMFHKSYPICENTNEDVASTSGVL